MRWYTFATHVSLAALFILGSGQALGQYPYPEQGGEARVVIVRQGGQLSITAPEHESLPAQVQQDLAAFALAVAALPLEIEQTFVMFSRYGKMAAAGKVYADDFFDPEPPTGIWIWPDWQNSATVHHFPEFSRVRFLGNDRYVRVQHRERIVQNAQDYMRTHKYIIDVTAPTQRYRLKGLALFRVATTGRWAGVRKDGQLFVGQLEAGNEQSIITGRQPVVTPSPVKNLLLLPDATYLLLELESGVLLTLTGDGSVQISSTVRRLYDSAHYADDHVVGGNSFYGWVGGPGQWQLAFLTVAADGNIVVEEMPGLSLSSGRPASSSPSGKYEVCYKDVFGLGGIESLILRTPKADPAVPIPPLEDPLIDALMEQTPRPVVGSAWIHWD